MKLISWNVNGIRSAINKGLLDFLSQEDPDVLCLQETKSPKVALNLELPGYEQFWSDAYKPGYSGTAVFTKQRPMKATMGIGVREHDQEGRTITCEFEKFILVNVYVPNAKRGLERLPYRQEWDRDFLDYLKKQEKKKPVIVCGDFNVAHQEIDLTYPKANVKNHGFTPQERAGFDAFIAAGFVDTFREKNLQGGHYTWWSQMNKCRARNIGWRIDYFLISNHLTSLLNDVFIYKDVLGSDHCPVGVLLNINK